ncbi:2-C-methyl-D-erythritol 2,4-cyclodiphosphate synthase [bacterium SCSIO 12696]|nr:2-C-methyl-D-erythritol 2,4-cyclodiphosphate synthase [bacterium SCSIO 12696]
MIRIGHGYDVHAFGPGDHLMLGGVAIAHNQGFVAHSDGDVLIHALCDGLLGAAGLGDIGRHFPDTDPQYKGIDSRELLRHVVSLLAERSWQLSNADITIVAQAPKMAPHISAMQDNLAADLNADVSQLNVKATTTEKLGFEGRQEGIACHAVVLIQAL